jgi:hypothetical protein
MFLYIVCDASESVVKIGYSTDPESRCRSLQTGYPLPLRVYYTVEVDQSRVRLLERQIHFELGPYRTRGEWFRISAARARSLLDYCIIRWADDPLLGS